MTRFGAIVLLFLFILHFTFYGKDFTEQETNADYGNFPDRPTDTSVKKIPQELEIQASDLDIKAPEEPKDSDR